MIKVKCSVTPDTKDRVAIYNLLINNRLAHTGKVYIFAGQDEVELNITDIIRSYAFKGKYINDILADSEFYYETVSIEIEGNVSSLNGVFFTLSDDFRERNQTLSPVPFFVNYQPVAHIAYGMKYRVMFPDNINCNNAVYVDDVQTDVVIGRTPNLRLFEYKPKQTISIDKRLVCSVDNCPKPYYLIWMTNSGAMQCQGFLKSSEFSKKYTVNKRVDMYDFQWDATKTSQAIWSLKSDNLSDRDYKAYGEMFNSQVLILYDVEYDAYYPVTISDTTYKEKTRRSENKPPFFEVEVQSSEIKTIM